MRVVTVIDGDRLRQLPLAPPDWAKQWCVGRYWGPNCPSSRGLSHVAPVKQSAIGTTPNLPVFVHVDGAHGILALLPFLTILATVLAAFGGAYFAATLNHRLSLERETVSANKEDRRIRRRDRLDGLDAVVGAAAAYLIAVNRAIADLGTPEFIDAQNSATDREVVMGQSIAALTARVGTGDVLIPVFEAIQTTAMRYSAAVNDLTGTFTSSVAGRGDLADIAESLRIEINAAIQFAHTTLEVEA